MSNYADKRKANSYHIKKEPSRQRELLQKKKILETKKFCDI